MENPKCSGTHLGLRLNRARDRSDYECASGRDD